jgi:hypothetical protein
MLSTHSDLPPAPLALTGCKLGFHSTLLLHDLFVLQIGNRKSQFEIRCLSLIEPHQRGIERAGKVTAVSDGAEWEQNM